MFFCVCFFFTNLLCITKFDKILNISAQIQNRFCFSFQALQLYWNRTPAWVFSCKFVVYFQNTFSLETPLDGCFWYVLPKRTPWCIWRFIPGNKYCIYILLMVSFILTSKRISIISFSVTTCFFIQKRRVFINAKCIRWNYICYSACTFAQPWSILEAAVRKCSSK